MPRQVVVCSGDVEKSVGHNEGVGNLSKRCCFDDGAGTFEKCVLACGVGEEVGIGQGLVMLGPALSVAQRAFLDWRSMSALQVGAMMMRL